MRSLALLTGYETKADRLERQVYLELEEEFKEQDYSKKEYEAFEDDPSLPPG